MPTLESSHALADVAHLYVGLAEARGLLCDFLDEACFPNTHDWRYLALIVWGVGAYSFADELLEVSVPSGDKLQSTSIYKDIEHPQDPIVASDLGITYYRLDRPDSQFIAHTTCNVAIRHVPTGMEVRSQVEFSRERNRMIAMSFLRAKLNDKKKRI